MAEGSVERAYEKVRRLVPDGYSGVKHLALLAALTLLPVPLFVVALVVWGATPWALAAAPIGVLFGNLVEYATHRWLMHHVRGRRLYRRHAGVHHAAFQRDAMHARDDRDWYHVMMTTRPATAFMFFIASLVGAAYMLEGGPFAAVLGITLCCYFFLEEAIHLSFHMRSTWFCDRWYNRLLRRLARAHQTHHDTRVMRDGNFNIVLPIFDVVLGTRVKG